MNSPDHLRSPTRDAFRRRLTYANVMSTLALFVALGGSSYAALTITGNDVRDGSITGADIKNGSLSARDLPVPNARKQVSEVERRRAQPRQAAAGVVGTGSAAGAYGAVHKGGTIQTSRSRNVVSVSHPSLGVYCITLAGQIDPYSTGLVVTPDYSTDTSNFANGNHAITEWRGGASECPVGTLQVSTGIQRSNGTIAKEDQSFFFSTGSGGSNSGMVKLSKGQTRTVAQSGALSIQAACTARPAAGADLAIEVGSSVSGALMSMSFDKFPRSYEPLARRQFFAGVSGTGTVYYDRPFVAVSPDGGMLTGTVSYGINMFGADCLVVPQLVG